MALPASIALADLSFEDGVGTVGRGKGFALAGSLIARQTARERDVRDAFLFDKLGDNVERLLRRGANPVGCLLQQSSVTTFLETICEGIGKRHTIGGI